MERTKLFFDVLPFKADGSSKLIPTHPLYFKTFSLENISYNKKAKEFTLTFESLTGEPLEVSDLFEVIEFKSIKLEKFKKEDEKKIKASSDEEFDLKEDEEVKVKFYFYRI